MNTLTLYAENFIEVRLVVSEIRQAKSKANFVALLFAEWLRHCTPKQAWGIIVMLSLLVQTPQGSRWFLVIYPLLWCI